MRAAQMMSEARATKEWSRAEVGRRVADKIGRDKPYVGEAVRKWEEATSKPDQATARALDDIYELDGRLTAEYGYRRAEGSTAGSPTTAELDAKLDQLIDGQGHVKADVDRSIARATRAVTVELVSLNRRLEEMGRILVSLLERDT